MECPHGEMRCIAPWRRWSIQTVITIWLFRNSLINRAYRTKLLAGATDTVALDNTGTTDYERMSESAITEVACPILQPDLGLLPQPRD